MVIVVLSMSYFVPTVAVDAFAAATIHRTMSSANSIAALPVMPAGGYLMPYGHRHGGEFGLPVAERRGAEVLVGVVGYGQKRQVPANATRQPIDGARRRILPTGTVRRFRSRGMPV